MSDLENDSSSSIQTGSAGRACDACHSKKTRCDMQQPVCGLCQRTNRTCHFPTFRKRPTRQSPSIKAKREKVNGSLDRLVELLEADKKSEAMSLLSENLSAKDSPDRQTHRPTGTSQIVSDSSGAAPDSLSPISNIEGLNSVAESSPESTNLPVPRELALHLIDVYFEKVEPWLPILHKPTFLQWSHRILGNGRDALSSLRGIDTLMFYCIFALAARFSSHDSFAAIPAKDRGERFANAAETYFRHIRDNGAENHGFNFLQACILLAFWHYASGSTRRGWYVTHMCIRRCYDFGLHQIDDEDEDDDADDENSEKTTDTASWVHKELLRRSFWAILEIDTMGSVMKQKPFGIDRRHIRVKVPVSDEAWFEGRKTESAKLVTGFECWKTLVGSPNQDERAWCFLSKVLAAQVFDLSLFREGLTDEQKSEIDNNISCFKLAMPDHFQMQNLPNLVSMDMPPARKNCIIATNLYLSATTYTTARLSTAVIQSSDSPDDFQPEQVSDYKNRLIELNEILRRWPPEYIQNAHPSLACTILLYDESLIRYLPPSNLVNSYRNLTGLILGKFAEKWKLGAVLLRIRDLAHNYLTSDEETKAELIKQYPVYFERFTRRKPNSQKLLAHLKNSHSYNNGITPGSSSSQMQLTPPTNTTAYTTGGNQFQFTGTPTAATKATTGQQQQQNLGGAGMDFNTMNTLNNLYDPNSFGMSDFNAFTSLGPSPSSDLDAIISGFVQEPMWSDYGVSNFMV